MTNLGKVSRISGLLYLIVVIAGMFSLAYVPNKLFNWTKPAATFDNISSNETLFRASLASSVLCYLSFILLPIFLYQLFENVNKYIARIIAVLAIVSVPISIANLTHKYSILTLLANLRSTGLQATEQVYDQVMTKLHAYNEGIFIVTIFWGLWLLPFGYLVYKSGFLPRILGILLMLGCLGYMVNFFGATLYGNYKELVIGRIMRYLPAVAEISTCFWLLIIGAKTKKTALS